MLSNAPSLSTTDMGRSAHAVTTAVTRDQIRTLPQAQEFLHRAWPGRDAPAAAWLTYHQTRAELFAHIAKIDPDHHHEAQALAGQEREQAEHWANKNPAGAE